MGDTVTADDFCWSCNRREPITRRPYQVCLECGHVYQTAGDLRRAYRREFWNGWRHWGGEPWWRLAWRLLTARASRIYFCQECTHDF